MLISVRRPWFVAALSGLALLLSLSLPPVASTATASSSATSPGSGRSRQVTLGRPHHLQITYTHRPPKRSRAELEALRQAIARSSHSGPRTPIDPNATVRTTPAPYTVKAPPPGNKLSSKQASAPTDFQGFRTTDFGARSGLIPEPTVATNGWAVMVTWNTYVGVSRDGGTNWSYVDPAAQFPSAFGGLCCDQSVLYDPTYDLYIWVLQYFPDANGDNEIRIAVSRGPENMLAGSWYYYDYTSQSGSNWDQPKIAVDGNHFFIEATSYGAASGSYLYRFPLRFMSAAAGCGCSVIGPFVEFSPGLVQGADQVMYFAAHRSTTQLRIFQWPDDSNSFFWNDINHTSYPQNYPYSCPRSGGNSTSDWCQRRSFGGGWAHSDRIFNGWIARGVIAFAWDASQGAGGFGTFANPYVHVVRVRLTDLNGDGGARSPLDEPYMNGNGFAIQYSQIAANALGGLGGVVEFGGGSSGIFQSCSIVMWDQYQTGWGLMLGYYGNTDPNDTLSGDYLMARGNGGNPRTWTGSCYRLLKANSGDTSTGNSHPLFLTFGRAEDSPLETLTSSSFGDGAGSVTSSPGGISACTGTCTAEFVHGTTVSLSASPDGDSTFGGWFGDCSGPTCSVTMNGDRSVYPYFVDIPPVATISPAGTITGATRVDFSEPVQKVTTKNLVLREAGSSSNLPVDLTCRNSANAVVKCSGNAVTSARLTPTDPLVPGMSYSVIADPSGAPTLIVDHQGSPVATTSVTFRAATVEQDASPGVGYEWAAVKSSSAFGKEYRISDRAEATASYGFTGAAITWYTVTGKGQGTAEVLIDGASKGVVDNSSAGADRYKVARSYSGLGAGAHVIKIVVRGKQGANGSGKAVAVDAFKVGQTVDANPDVVYRWGSQTDPAAFGGAYSSESRAGATASFRFAGTGVTWFTVLGPSQGQAKVFIDNVPVATFDNYAATSTFKVGRSFGGLASGKHTIRISVLGTKQAASTGTLVAVDEFSVA